MLFRTFNVIRLSFPIEWVGLANDIHYSGPNSHRLGGLPGCQDHDLGGHVGSTPSSVLSESNLLLNSLNSI